MGTERGEMPVPHPPGLEERETQALPDFKGGSEKTTERLLSPYLSQTWGRGVQAELRESLFWETTRALSLRLQFLVMSGGSPRLHPVAKFGLQNVAQRLRASGVGGKAGGRRASGLAGGGAAGLRDWPAPGGGASL